MGVSYTEGVVRRGMSLERFVDITSTNAAKIMGLYPRKGIIAAGSDADITIIDPNISETAVARRPALGGLQHLGGLADRGLASNDHLLRGNVMVEDRKLVGTPSTGRFVKRKIDSEVLARPVC